MANLSGLPPRPPGLGNRAFHGSQFRDFEKFGFTIGSPAVDVAPVFLYSRSRSFYSPCYPESAIVLGSDPPRPNPGTSFKRGPASANPGADCTHPGPYRGEYTPGKPFPVYVGATLCGREWRVNYDVYYVHDGAVLEGHRHDWEGVTIVFKEAELGEDWWYTDSIILNKHHWHDQWLWGEMQTVNVYTEDPNPAMTDITNEVFANYRSHPKIYVGFYSHAAFRDKCNYCRRDMVAPFTEKIADGEYRSAHWWRLPRPEDFHSWSEIDPKWDYGHATSTPPRNKLDMCNW